MSQSQFLGLLLAVAVSSALSAAGVFLFVWRRLQDMFARALMHGGSLDTLSRTIKADSAETRSIATGAADVSRAFKGRLDDHEGRLRKIEKHPLWRPLGGGGDMEGA